MSDWPSGGTGKMLSFVSAFPDHLEASSNLAGLKDIAPLDKSCRQIVFCGMGGSAIAGELVQPLLFDQKVSLTVWRDYGLPHWVSSEDLVIAASYSGNTEESLSALEAALSLGCRVIGVSSGGTLKDFAEKENEAGFPRVELPGGLPPRAALGHGFGALLHILAALEVVPDQAKNIADACGQLREASAECLSPWTNNNFSDPVDRNATNVSPGQLAKDLSGKIPVLYTAGPEAHGPGSRWKAQLNENSKLPVCLASFPELNHNDLVGWSLSGDLQSKFALIVLQSESLDSRSQLRVEATMKLLEGEFSSSHKVIASGKSALARVLSLVQYGDYLSCHLAHLAGVDPMPVERIENLKIILANG